MAATPLTHHEIMALAAPFARRGRQVDLARSDRLARVLRFRPQPLPDDTALHAALRLEDGARAGHRLVREIALPSGALAELQAEGDDAAELIARLDAVPAAAQWRRGDGWELALGQRAMPAGDDGVPRLVTAWVDVRLAGLQLRLTLPSVSGIVAEVEVHSPDGSIATLPDDLLAVLGGGWSSLWRLGDRWRGSFAAPRREPQRSEAALAQAERAADHLVRTLAEPPARFHERLAAARWRVAARRTLPLLAALGLVAASFVITSLDLARDSVWRMLIFNAPPILLALGVCLQELPRFEWPRVPRAPAIAAWRSPPSPPPSTQ